MGTKLKVLTILGTRPEIIRLACVLPKLDQIFEHKIWYTGQNYDHNLKDIFFEQLQLCSPDFTSKVRGTFAQQVAIEYQDLERILTSKFKPDKILILGDTNSSLSVLVAKRMGIQIYHMEAGNRCFNNKVPEEINRRVIDSCSDILMPYSERSRRFLLSEGYQNSKIFVIGNPIVEVMKNYQNQIEASTILNDLVLNRGKYFLITIHRYENITDKSRFQRILEICNNITEKYQVPAIWGMHPHTRDKITEQCLWGAFGNKIQVKNPFGFFDFVKLESNAFGVLSDSGTVQEECNLLNIPALILREESERVETVENGGSLVVGLDESKIESACMYLFDSGFMEGRNPGCPHEYYANTSDRVINIMLST